MRVFPLLPWPGGGARQCLEVSLRRIRERRRQFPHPIPTDAGPGGAARLLCGAQCRPVRQGGGQ